MTRSNNFTLARLWMINNRNVLIGEIMNESFNSIQTNSKDIQYLINRELVAESCLNKGRLRKYT